METTRRLGGLGTDVDAARERSAIAAVSNV
jgi:hypothetical protein